VDPLSGLIRRERRQADTYADQFMTIHVSELLLGGAYSRLSSAALASQTTPSSMPLSSVVQGRLLRELLLEATPLEIGDVTL
jgi:hypothetical protein